MLKQLFFVVSLSVVAGCLQERSPINRVQPDYIDKMDVIPNQYKQLSADKSQTPGILSAALIAREPVFFTQTTLISKPTTTGFTGLTSYSQMDKIRWQVTENLLVARQAFAFVRNAPDSSTGIGQNQQTGDVVAAYKISSHFDIRRDYNSTTGEELNVVVENDSDRPWYQRQYMRIDWSQNLITGYNSVIFEQDLQPLSGQIQAEPVPVFVNTPNDPNAPVFSYSSDGAGGKRLDYFDVVNQAVMHPELVFYGGDDYIGPGGIPLCWLGEGATDCAPAQVTFRVSFRRQDETRDYEPASITEPLPDKNGNVQNVAHLNQERFGFFDASRIGFDAKAHATLDTQRIHYAARHNLWQHHHALIYAGDTTGAACKSDSDCTGGKVCHIENSQKAEFARGFCDSLAIGHGTPQTSTYKDRKGFVVADGNGNPLCAPLKVAKLEVQKDGAGNIIVDINGLPVMGPAKDADGHILYTNSTNDRDPDGNPIYTAISAADGSRLCEPVRDSGGKIVFDSHDPKCTTDDDCRQVGDSGGISKTAVCDKASKTCGEHYSRCSNDADCAHIDPQSTCDLAIAYSRADNKGLCLMPLRQRQVRPITYFESVNYPEYMQPVTESIVSEWNGAFVESVTAARRRECEIANNIDPTKPSGSNPCNQPAITGLDPKLGSDAQFIFVGCHSPVWGTASGPGQHKQEEVDVAHGKGWDLAACGPQGTSARLGDLRYNMMAAITDQDNQGYWGLANIAADPDTGEMVVGRGAVWQTITDYYANYLIELVQLLNGDLTADQFAGGADLVSAMERVGSGKGPSYEILDKPFENGGLTKIAKAPDGLARLKLPNPSGFQIGMPMVRDGQNPGAIALSEARLAQGRVLGDGNNAGAQRLFSLRGTSLEGRLMNAEQARLAPTSMPDDSAVLKTTLDAASPLRRQSREVQRVLDRLRQKLSAYQCGMEAGFADDLLLGLAQRLKDGAPIDPNNSVDSDVAFGGVPDAHGVPTGSAWDFKLRDNNGNLIIDQATKKQKINYPLMQQYAAQFIHHGVLAHELGHSIGQRHNFTASADAVNYHPNYWKYRLQGHPDKKGDHGLRPRYEYVADGEGFYSKAEIDGRVDEYAYSSVMDYKGLNEDAHGIGRYDVAFVKNGYVNMAEAFKTVKDVSGALVYGSQTAGYGLSTSLDLRQGLKGVHYTQLPAIFGANSDGTPKIGDENRYNVFLRETKSTSVPAWGPPNFTNATKDNHILVPYRFDSDERAGLVWQDQRYDNGGDAYESFHYVASHLLDYYFVNSYARLRTGFSTQKYVKRLWSRYLNQMHQTMQIEAFDLLRWQDIFAGSSQYDFAGYMTDPKRFGGVVNKAAMAVTADAMTALVTMPEIGGHNDVTQFDGTTHLLSNEYGGGVNIPINEGRAFESSWKNEAGFWWYEQLDRAGTYFDKTAALQVMTDPELLLLTRSTPVDLRTFQLSFYTMFPDKMTRLFGGILAEDYGDFAPIYSYDKASIQRLHVLDITQSSADQNRILDNSNALLDPEAHFTTQLWAAVTTVAQFPATYDQTYMDHARLWIDGGVESVDVPKERTVAFTDPWSGQTYRALHIGCGVGEPGESVGCSEYVHASAPIAKEAGVAARMILHINDMETIRQKAITDTDMAAAALIETQEKKYLDLLNVMRDLTQTFGHGLSKTE